MAACEAGADALGFVFAEEARARNRYLDPDATQRLCEQLPPCVLRVAVCVNETPERLREYLEIVDRVQLHGEESPEACRAVAGKAIKAFRAGPEFEPESMLAYPATAYLLDAYVKDARGGTGQTCDWDVARATVALGKPIILAGGLTPDNVAEAVRRVRPYGVDTSGGVEAAPGKKDHEKVRSFIRHGKAALSVSG